MKRSDPSVRRTLARIGIITLFLAVLGGVVLSQVMASGQQEQQAQPVQMAGNTKPATVAAQPPATPASTQPTASASDMNVARSLQNAFRSVSQQVLPVVVEVNVVDVVQQPAQTTTSPFNYFFGPQQGSTQPRQYKQYGLGSGVIVQRDGQKVYVLTNNHVAGNAEEITVKLYDGREYPATLVGADERLDLALVMFTTKEDVPVAKLGNSDSLMVGDWVLAVGNPLGFESTVTSGIVSAVGRRPEASGQFSGFTDYIQTDAAINEGNSGGALVNLDGEIIGINTWIASNSGGSIGLGFAIPINRAKSAIPQFIKSGAVQYGWLGVTTGSIIDQYQKDLNLTDTNGAFIYSVIQGSPADKAGVLPGDYVTAVGSDKLQAPSDLTTIVGSLNAGTTEPLTITRYGRQMSLDVTFSARPSDQQLTNEASKIWPGMAVVPLTDDIRSQLSIPKNVGDLIVAGVEQGGSAEIAGIRNGDIIDKVGNTDVKNLMDFYKALNAQKAQGLDLTLNRRGTQVTISLPR